MPAIDYSLKRYSTASPREERSLDGRSSRQFHQSCHSAQGSTSSTPVPSKSLRFRVAQVAPCARQMAAMHPFPQDLHGSPPFIRSQYPDSRSTSAARLSWGHAPAELIA